MCSEKRVFEPIMDDNEDTDFMEDEIITESQHTITQRNYENQRYVSTNADTGQSVEYNTSRVYAGNLPFKLVAHKTEDEEKRGVGKVVYLNPADTHRNHMSVVNKIIFEAEHRRNHIANH